MQDSMPQMRAAGGGMNLTDSVYERLLYDRIIVLGSEVEDEVANRIVAQMLLLAAEKPTEDIKLYINSPGGSVTAGFAIYDTMQLITPDVQTYAMGMAASMGQFLLSAGAPGKRFVLPYCKVMMHQPHGGVGGTASDIVIRAEMLTRWKQEIAEITAARTGKSVEQINHDGDRDRWFSAEEAVEYGLADHVVSNAMAIPTTNTRS